MKKATVTYNPAQGESKVLEYLGTTLYAGQAKEVVCDDDVMERLQTNQYFKVTGVADHTPEPKEASKDDASKEGPKTEKTESESHGKTHR